MITTYYMAKLAETIQNDGPDFESCVRVAEIHFNVRSLKTSTVT